MKPTLIFFRLRSGQVYLSVISFILSTSFTFSQDVTLTFDCPDDVEVGSEGIILPINIDAEEDIWGIQIDIPFDPEQIEIIDVIGGEIIDETFSWGVSDDNQLWIICFNLESEICIPANLGTAFNVEFNVIGAVGNEIEFSFAPSTIMVDDLGQPMDSDISDTCTIAVAESLDCSIPGDVNNDGIVNVLDIVEVIGCVLDNPCPDCSDVNEDGVLNILDIVIMVNIILEG